MRVLQLGCGRRKVKGAIGIDLSPLSDADVICNLDHFPYPFRDNVFDCIICEHILEHLDNVVKVIEEIHRLGKAGARVIIEVPHFSSVFAFSDPTHKHFFSSRSFDYFVRETEVSEFNYSSARFEIDRVEILHRRQDPLSRFLSWLINKYIRQYEERFAFILPRHTLRFDLKIIKPPSTSR